MSHSDLRKRQEEWVDSLTALEIDRYVNGKTMFYNHATLEIQQGFKAAIKAYESSPLFLAMKEALEFVKMEIETCDFDCNNCGEDPIAEEYDLYTNTCKALNEIKESEKP